MTRARRPPAGSGRRGASYALVLPLLVLVGASPARAQDTPPPSDPREAQPERPTVATHAFTVAPGYAEVEAGVQRQGTGPGSSQVSAPILLKIGLARGLQLDVAPGWVRNLTDGRSTSGPADTSVGVKWHLSDRAPVVGAFAVQSTVSLATGSFARGTGTGTTALNLVLISSHDVHGVSVDANLGYTRRSGDGTKAPRTSTLWTLSAGIPLPGTLGWAAEIFGYPGTSGPAGHPPQVGFLTGPTLKVVKQLVLDAGAIFDVRNLGGRAYYAGVTWNIGRVWGPPPPGGTAPTSSPARR